VRRSPSRRPMTATANYSTALTATHPRPPGSPNSSCTCATSFARCPSRAATRHVVGVAHSPGWRFAPTGTAEKNSAGPDPRRSPGPAGGEVAVSGHADTRILGTEDVIDAPGSREASAMVNTAAVRNSVFKAGTGHLINEASGWPTSRSRRRLGERGATRFTLSGWCDSACRGEARAGLTGIRTGHCRVRGDAAGETRRRFSSRPSA